MRNWTMIPKHAAVNTKDEAVLAEIVGQIQGSKRDEATGQTLYEARDYLYSCSRLGFIVLI